MTTKPTSQPSLSPPSGVEHTEDQEPEYAVKNIHSDPTTALPSLREYGSEGKEANIQGESKKQLKRYSLAFSLTTFGYGPAWGSMGTYFVYQIQVIGFLVGFNPGQEPGTGCLSLELPCRVPFGSSDVNITSYVLYLNAFVFALSGVLILLVCGWGDHIRYKREQYISLLVIMGILALPAAGMTSLNLTTFNALAALFVVSSIIGSVSTAWQNVFVPYTMEKAAPITTALGTHHHDLSEDDIIQLRNKREREGLKISVWGSNALYLGVTIFFCITIGLSYINADAQVNAGLYVTSASGAVCIICALVGWRFLPVPNNKPMKQGHSFWLLPFSTFKSLWQGIAKYPEAFKFLIAYTIYLDSALTIGTVITNLFNLTVRPSLVEYTAWTVVGSGTSMISATIFLFLFPRLGLSLKQWAIAAYILVALIAMWCLIGMSDSVGIGFKTRAEFYVFQVLQNVAGSILTPLFRVLFPEVFPKGSEIQYFGFQMVLSSGTVWIPQIINGPIVDATNNPRLPAVLSLIAYLIAIGITLWMNEEKGMATVRKEEIDELVERQGDVRAVE